MSHTVNIHSWVLVLLGLGISAMFILLIVMLHVHYGDVAYIKEMKRPIKFYVPGPPTITT